MNAKRRKCDETQQQLALALLPPVEWVDDNEWNAIENAFNAISNPSPIFLTSSPLMLSSTTILPSSFPSVQSPLPARLPDSSVIFPPHQWRNGGISGTACHSRSQGSARVQCGNQSPGISPGDGEAEELPSEDALNRGEAILPDSELAAQEENGDSEHRSGGSFTDQLLRRLPGWMLPQRSSKKDSAFEPGRGMMTGLEMLREESTVSEGVDGNVEPGKVPSFMEQTVGNPYALVRYEEPLQWGLQPSLLFEIKPKLPAIHFRGQIVYSKTESEVNAATLELCQRVRQLQETTQGAIPLGLDLEWKASFERGQEPRKAAVLQLCLDGHRCDVMQIIYSGIPLSLQDLLEGSSTLKVGVGVHGDAARLRQDYQIATCKVVDLRVLANKKMNNSKQWSLSSLAQELTGKQVEKIQSMRCGDWEACPLSEPQLQYAATDAFASWHLYQVLASFPEFAIENSDSNGIEGKRSVAEPPVA